MTLSATYGAKVWEIALSTNRVGEVVTFLHFGLKDVTISVKFVEQQARA